MKKIFSISLLIITINLYFLLPSWASTVKVEIVHSQDQYQVGETYPMLFHITIDKGWYLHGPVDEGSGLIPTVLSFQAPPAITVEGIKFPEPGKQKFEYAEELIEVYSGEILLRASLVVNSNAPPGPAEIKGKLTYQACNDKVCKRPEKTSITFPLSVVSKGTPTTSLNPEKFNSLRGGA